MSSQMHLNFNLNFFWEFHYSAFLTFYKKDPHKKVMQELIFSPKLLFNVEEREKIFKLLVIQATIAT